MSANALRLHFVSATFDYRITQSNTKHIREITIIFIVSTQYPINSYACIHPHFCEFGWMTKDKIYCLFMSFEFCLSYHFKHTHFFLITFSTFSSKLENSIAFYFLKSRCSRAPGTSWQTTQRDKRSLARNAFRGSPPLHPRIGLQSSSQGIWGKFLGSSKTIDNRLELYPLVLY